MARASAGAAGRVGGGTSVGVHQRKATSDGMAVFGVAGHRCALQGEGKAVHAVRAVVGHLYLLRVKTPIQH